MQYFFCVDESGDFFEPDKKEMWVVAGALFRCGRNEAVRLVTESLTAVFTEIPELYEYFKLPTMLHWYELTNKASAKHRIAGQFLGKVRKEVFKQLQEHHNEIRFFAVYDPVFRTVRDGNTVYLSMLFDLIALLESALDDYESPSELDIVVEVRNKRRIDETWLPTTNKKDLRRAKDALLRRAEVGLSSRGLADLVRKDGGLKVEPKHQWECCAIAAADVVVNTAYHKYGPKDIQELIGNLCQKPNPRMFLFDSSGDFEERRSRISARDGDFPAAIYWWLNRPDVHADPCDHLKDLLERAACQPGPESARATLESLIERLWQQAVSEGSFASLLEKLFKIERALKHVVDNDQRRLALIFRLRNFMLAIANHLGDVTAAALIEGDQANSLPVVSLIPDNLSLVLDYQIYAIERKVNCLMFNDALARASDRVGTIKYFRDCWEDINGFVLENNALSTQFNTSRVFVKSECTWIRCWALEKLPADGSNNVIQSEIGAIRERIDGLIELPLHSEDRSRLRNYQVMLLLRAGLREEALNLSAQALTENPRPFDILWVTRAAADRALFDQVTELPCQILQQIRPLLDINDIIHPHEIIRREYGLLEFLVGRKKAARPSFVRSGDGHRAGPPIYDWLIGLLTMHMDFVAGNVKNSVSEYFQTSSDTVRALAERADRLDNGLSVIQRARLVSPY